MKNKKTKYVDIIKTKMIAPCGMNCALCIAHLRDKKVCPGCLEFNLDKSKSCNECKIKLCTQTKNIKYCFKCNEFPCAKIKHIDKRYRTKYDMSMIANLKKIKEIGIRKFIKNEKEKWVCPGCGGIVCVHKETCIYCGSLKVKRNKL